MPTRLELLLEAYLSRKEAQAADLKVLQMQRTDQRKTAKRRKTPKKT